MTKQVKMMRIGFLITMLVGAGYAYSQTTVNQGKPGNQGSWPVVISGTVPGAASIVSGPDGGAVLVQPILCTQASAHKITTVGTSAGNTPTTQESNRLYIEMCNSLQNSGNPTVKCRADGTPPVMAAGNAGDVLGVGDCIRYTIPASNTPQCIADAASTNVTSYECVAIGP